MSNRTIPRGGALIIGVLGVSLAMGIPGCHDDDDYGGYTGASCDVADECYPGIDHEELAGEVVCMELVEGGYCTHTCDSHSDCCSVEGECGSDLEQVCAPFESADEYYCFLSCEGEVDGDAFCQEWAHVDFICRSTGGGSDNQKVCVPNG